MLVNGGGTAAQNYQSHLLHVQQIHDLLLRAGVAPDRITIFASDGEDTGRDLAVRSPQPEPDFWLVRGTRLEGPLRTPVTREDSRIAGVTHPRTGLPLNVVLQPGA